MYAQNLLHTLFLELVKTFDQVSELRDKLSFPEETLLGMTAFELQLVSGRLPEILQIKEKSMFLLLFHMSNFIYCLVVTKLKYGPLYLWYPQFLTTVSQVKVFSATINFTHQNV